MFVGRQGKAHVCSCSFVFIRSFSFSFSPQQSVQVAEEKTSMRAVFAVARREGLSALYRGATPNIVGAGLAWGSYFHFYERLKHEMRRSLGRPLGAPEHTAAALLASNFNPGKKRERESPQLNFAGPSQ
jgi:hypothetical protein